MEQREGYKMKPYALEEIQSLFHRQIKDNAIDVFLANFKDSNKRINFGQIKDDQDFDLYTPSGTLYSERSYYGSELSYTVADVFNQQYGVLALSAKLINKAQRTVAREVVRGLVKNSIAITAAYFDQFIGGRYIQSGTVCFPHKDSFYARVFDPVSIRTHMRRGAVKHLDLLYAKGKRPRPVFLKNSDEQVDSFVFLCESFGLPEINLLIGNLPNIQRSADARESMVDLVGFLKMWSRQDSKKFYKELNNLFV